MPCDEIFCIVIDLATLKVVSENRAGMSSALRTAILMTLAARHDFLRSRPCEGTLAVLLALSGDENVSDMDRMLKKCTYEIPYVLQYAGNGYSGRMLPVNDDDVSFRGEMHYYPPGIDVPDRKELATSLAEKILGDVGFSVKLNDKELLMEQKHSQRGPSPESASPLLDFRMPDVKWLPNLSMYKLTAMEFPTKAEADKAIDLFGEGELNGMPFDIADGLTLVVPSAAIPVFTAAGLDFRQMPARM